MSGSGISWAICKSVPRSRQMTTPAPHHSIFYRPDALPAAQPTASKHWKQNAKDQSRSHEFNDMFYQTECRPLKCIQDYNDFSHNHKITTELTIRNKLSCGVDKKVIGERYRQLRQDGSASMKDRTGEEHRIDAHTASDKNNEYVVS